MEGAPGAAPAAEPAVAGAADAGQPAHHPSLQQQQHVALKRLREGLADLSARQEQGQRAAKRPELSRPGSGGDGSGDGTNDGSGPGASVMLLDVPQGGHTTSLLLPSQQPNSSSGGGGQPPLPPGLKPRPASHEPTGTHVGGPGSASASPGGPNNGPAPPSGGSGGTDGAAEQPPQAACGHADGGGMQHAASLESLVPSSGPALAQMDAAQPLEPEPEPHREHVEPAPSSRLGTLKRDRSPSPSNGALLASVGAGMLGLLRIAFCVGSSASKRALLAVPCLEEGNGMGTSAPAGQALGAASSPQLKRVSLIPPAHRSTPPCPRPPQAPCARAPAAAA